MVFATFIIAIILVEMLVFNRGFAFNKLFGLERHYSISDGSLHQFQLENGELFAQDNDPNITFDQINLPIAYISINCNNSIPRAVGQIFYRNGTEPFSESHSIWYDPSLGEQTISLPTLLPVSSLRFDLTYIPHDTITCDEFVINPRVPIKLNFFRLAIYMGLLLDAVLYNFRNIKPIKALLLEFNLLNVNLVFFGIILALYQFENNFGLDKVAGGWRFLAGREGAIKAYGPVITYGKENGDRSDVLYCLEILNKVPGPAPVLNLNGFAAVEPCLFSPLLPRDKIVHHYEAVAITEPYYRTLMFGEPESAYKIYRELGINYFYIRKNDLMYVNFGYSHALEPQYLEQYFDVYAESSDFYILTWRGAGLYPVSAQLSQIISTWYAESKDSRYFWWRGRVMLEDWIQLQGGKNPSTP